MITAGLVNALYAWANGNTENIAELRAKRDALIGAFLGGPDNSSAITSGSLNGKNFTALVSMTREDKLTLFTEVLTLLGEIDARPTVTGQNFSGLIR